jgi:hypothetical protein
MLRLPLDRGGLLAFILSEAGEFVLDASLQSSENGVPRGIGTPEQAIRSQSPKVD